MIARIELGGTSVCVDGIRDLVVAALVQAAQVKPHLRDVWIDSDGSRVCVERIAELVYLEIEYADGAPEGGIPAIAVDGLLISFVCLVILLTCHIRSPEEIPTLSIGRVCFETLGQELDGKFLVLERRSLLVVEPAELLENFCMSGVVVDHALVRALGTGIVILLFVNVAYLEPDVRMCEGTGWIAKDAVETTEGLVVFSLLLVDDTQTEQDFVCLVKV